MTIATGTSKRFDVAFATVARHFRLSKDERSVALRYALDDYGRACQCYYAIARSLKS